MTTKHTVRKRVRYEMFILMALVLVLVTVVLWKDGKAREAAAIPPSPTAAPTAIPSPSPIPADMFEWREGEYVHVEYGEGNSLYIDQSRFNDPTTKTSADLVVWVQMAWENQWGYVWGTFGDQLTEDLLSYKLEQYPEGVGDYEDIIREKWMNRRVADCVGLIKGYGWYNPNSGNIAYGYGAMVDCDTEGLYDRATVKGDMATMPDTPGIVLHAPGHVGVYIGDGYVIEAIATAGGVVKTRLADRPWQQWMECPYITYNT